LKEEINASVYSVYDYLLGKRKSPELSRMLRTTFLSTDFLTALIDEIDIAALIKPVLQEQVANWIPAGMEFVTTYVHSGIDDLVVNQEPWIRNQLKDAAGPLADYLIGTRETFNFTVSTESLVEELEEILLQNIGKLPIPELAGLPPVLIELAFNEFFDDLSQFIPPSIEIDETIIGEDVPDQIMASLTEAESALDEMREYIHTFQLGYIILIVVMVLLAAGIFLIYRELKGTVRTLGIIFLAFGVSELICFLVARNVTGAQMEKLADDIPEQLHLWLQQLANNALAPLQILSIGFIVGGVVLLVLSFAYKSRYAAERW
jgi:hypothetical protein